MNEQTVVKFSELFAACAVKGDFGGLRKEAVARQLIKQAVDPYHVALSSIVGATAGGTTGYFGTQEDKKKKRNAIYGAITGATLGAGVPLMLGGTNIAAKALDNKAPAQAPKPPIIKPMTPKEFNAQEGFHASNPDPAAVKRNARTQAAIKEEDGRSLAEKITGTPKTHVNSWFLEALKRLGYKDIDTSAPNIFNSESAEAAGIDPRSSVGRAAWWNPNNTTFSALTGAAGAASFAAGNRGIDRLQDSREARRATAIQFLNSIMNDPDKKVTAQTRDAARSIQNLGEKLNPRALLSLFSGMPSRGAEAAARAQVDSGRYSAVDPLTQKPDRVGSPGNFPKNPELGERPEWKKPNTPPQNPKQKGNRDRAEQKVKEEGKSWDAKAQQYSSKTKTWLENNFSWLQGGRQRAADTRALASAYEDLSAGRGLSARSLAAVARDINSRGGNVTPEDLTRRFNTTANKLRTTRRGEKGGLPERSRGLRPGPRGAAGLGGLFGWLAGDPAAAEAILTGLYSKRKEE